MVASLEEAQGLLSHFDSLYLGYITQGGAGVALAGCYEPSRLSLRAGCFFFPTHPGRLGCCARYLYGNPTPPPSVSTLCLEKGIHPSSQALFATPSRTASSCGESKRGSEDLCSCRYCCVTVRTMDHAPRREPVQPQKKRMEKTGLRIT